MEKIVLKLEWIRNDENELIDLTVLKIKRTSTHIPTIILDAMLLSNIFSITTTMEEISVVCPSQLLLQLEDCDSIEIAEPGWVSFKVHGLLDFSLVGILSAISRALQEASVSMFAISTYNTDYILIKAADAVRVEDALNSFQGSEMYEMKFLAK